MCWTQNDEEQARGIETAATAKDRSEFYEAMQDEDVVAAIEDAQSNTGIKPLQMWPRNEVKRDLSARR